MAGDVRDKKSAPRRRERSISYIDRDALFTFCGETIKRKREIRGRCRVLPDIQKLVFEKGSQIVEHSADQCGLAVIYRAARHHSKKIHVRRVLPGVDAGMQHQKYPSCFFASMEAPASRSMIRPCRSDRRDDTSSWMIASTVSAALSSAPVSG